MPEQPRTRVPLGILAACTGAVAVASLFSRKTGACGTAHYLFFQLLGGSIVSTVEETFQAKIPYDHVIARALILGFNVAAFFLLLRLWYSKGPRRWFVWGAVALTALYLASYFFFFPTIDCP